MPRVIKFSKDKKNGHFEINFKKFFDKIEIFSFE